MPQTLAQVLAAINAAHGTVLAGASTHEQEAATRIAARVALVHRTGKPGGTGPSVIFNSERLDAVDVCTDCERALGIPRAVYFFVGSGAYGKGNHALLVEPSQIANTPATATPFDTGACMHPDGHLERPSSPFTSDAQRCTHLDQHLLIDAQTGLADFTRVYLVAHFDAPLDYLTRGQQSLPDRSCHHGLISPSNDRRAWTIEVQRHAALQLSPVGGVLQAIIVDGRDLVLDLPPRYRRLAVVASPRSMYTAIADFCRNRATS